MAVNGPFTRRARAVIATNVLFSSAIAIIIVVFANVFVSSAAEKRSLRFDWSGRGWHSLTQSTKDFFRGIADPIEVYVVYGEDDTLRRAARFDANAQTADSGLMERVYIPLFYRMTQQLASVLNEASAANRRIEWHVGYYDREVERTREWATKLGISGRELVNAVVFKSRVTNAVKAIPLAKFFQVEYGGPRPNQPRVEPRIWGEMVEEGIVFGIRSVFEARERKVYVVGGHGELVQQAVPALLSADGFKVEDLIIERAPRVPADAAALICLSPATAWTPEARDALTRYVAEGGRLFLAQGARAREPFAGILERADAKILDVELKHERSFFEPQGKFALYGWDFLEPMEGAAHLVTERVREARRPLFLGFSRMYEIGARYDRDRVKRSVIIRSGAGAEAVPFVEENGEIRMRPNLGTKTGDFALGLALEFSGSANRTVGKVVSVASDQWLDLGALTGGGTANADLLRSAIHWLTDSVEFVPTRTKSAQSAIAPLDEDGFKTFTVITAFLVPGIVFLAGVFVFAMRRRI